MPNGVGEQVDIRITGGTEQTWGDYQRGPKTSENTFEWSGAGLLGEVSDMKDALPYVFAWGIWCNEHSVGELPPVRIGMNMVMKTKAEGGRAAETLKVFLEPNYSEMTQGDLRQITEQILSEAQKIKLKQVPKDKK